MRLDPDCHPLQCRSIEVSVIEYHVQLKFMFCRLYRYLPRHGHVSLFMPPLICISTYSGINFSAKEATQYQSESGQEC